MSYFLIYFSITNLYADSNGKIRIILIITDIQNIVMGCPSVCLSICLSQKFRSRIMIHFYSSGSGFHGTDNGTVYINLYQSRNIQIQNLKIHYNSIYRNEALVMLILNIYYYRLIWVKFRFIFVTPFLTPEVINEVVSPWKTPFISGTKTKFFFKCLLRNFNKISFKITF